MFRLLGLLAGLAGATDLGTGGQPDESLRRCVVASRLARAVDADQSVVGDVVVVSLLEHVGCTAYAHEAAAVWGDDIATTHAALMTDADSALDAFRTFLPTVASGTGRSLPRVAVTMARTMRTMSRDAPVATCEVAQEAGRRLGLSKVAQDSLGHMTAMWNGKGFPRTGGEQIPFPARVMHVAGTALLFRGLGGDEAAVEQVRRRAGGELDPHLAAVFVRRSGELLDGLDADDPLQAALDAEPDPVVWVDDDRLLDVARVFGDLVDLKSPWLHGHSSAVGDLAGAAAEVLGLAEAGEVRVAGHLHDVGRVGISSRIWDLTRPWTAAEEDQARLHAYHTERVLARTPELERIAGIAAAHHERCDGSGYHRGLRGDMLVIGARLLAAADAYRTLIEDRPHRTGLPAAQARQRLEADVRAGLLDADAVAAVLAAAGGATRRRPSGAVGLTARQLEVLRLVAHGMSNREIARRLGVSPRTIDRHVSDVYERIGVRSRAAAAMFTIEHGLAGPVQGSGGGAGHEGEIG
ncbi:HD domain-containing protein [Mumia zhuanghuii]|uniref:HD domain-containing phosphohydrolase n=2 Tax=Mumia TaxID=1546255 RepID=A0ABW1QGF3_9ACTN|nr:MULTISPECIES: HD domain-containing phosphohydrolase [Mumia]KAA1422699.1 HD domain-containing protein [Mumia zhuanghuii]